LSREERVIWREKKRLRRPPQRGQGLAKEEERIEKMERKKSI